MSIEVHDFKHKSIPLTQFIRDSKPENRDSHGAINSISLKKLRHDLWPKRGDIESI